MPDQVHPLAGRRILVVEDEYLIAKELKRWLQDAGSEVLGPVPSVEEALDLIEDHRPDAAVLDFNLGEGETADPVAVRLASIGVPYLFATGDVRRTVTGAEADRMRLEKPYLETELMLALTRMLN